MTQKTDPIGLYDPLLSAVSPKGNHPHFVGGYKVWPDSARVARADLRIMAIGNSTSLWPASPWSLEVAKRLTKPNRVVSVHNGAGKGNTSSQEVLRVLRDAPALKPNIILSLSGICDIGYLLNAKGYPFRHKYMRRAMDSLQETGLVDDVVFGVPDNVSPAKTWCRNQRFAAVLAKEIGAQMLTFLQPVQGIGAYPQTDQERAFFAQKASVVLKAANKPYGECVIDFYTEVREIVASNPAAYAHIVDLTAVFDNCPGAFRDHRHQSPEGVTHLAQSIMPYVESITGKVETAGNKNRGPVE